MMMYSVKVNTNLFQGGEVKDNACRFCRQMYNWNLPHVNLPLILWGIALWQHTSFTEVMEKNLWRIKSRRSAVFLKMKLCENKRKRTLDRIPFIFSNVFVWATTIRAMERSLHIHSSYPILVGASYLPQSWHLSKLTMLNQKSIFKTCLTQNIT